MKIVILDGYTENPGDLSWEGFENLGELTVYDRTPVDEIVSRIGAAEAILTNKCPITADTLAKCPSLKYIGVLATGYNVVDVEAAKNSGVIVANIPTYGTTAVAQFVFALLLEVCHNIGLHSSAVKAGEWTNNIEWTFWKKPLIELDDKTMGIVGFGRIGKAVARIAEAFGMNVIACDDHTEAFEGGQAKQVTLDELYSQSDVISLHVPLFPSTQGMINKESIAKMKDGAIIINTSRGPLINEQELSDAVKSGKIYAAGLDVVSTEPITMDNLLLKADNIFITPHIAWAPKESRSRLMNIAVENLKAYQDGNPVNVVNL